MSQLNKRFLLIGIVVALIFMSCNSRPDGVLSRDDMANILYEMHKLDGSLDIKGISYNQNNEKADYYKSILDKYNITQAEFDSSLIWYGKNPKKFTRVYDDVYEQLTQLQEDVKNGKFHKIDSIELLKVRIELWNKSQKYTFNKDSARTKLNFEIKNSGLQYGDVYILKFLQQIAPSDSSENKHILLTINYFNGKNDSLYLKTYNDSLLRRYNIRFPAVRKLKIRSISGELLGSTKYKGTFQSLTDSISLMREYRSDLQDSIRKEVQKLDPVIYKDKTETPNDSVKKKKITVTKPVLKANKSAE